MNRLRIQGLGRRESLMALLFLAPSLIGFSLFYLIPFIVGILESMSDRALGGSFVGLDNYREVLGSTSFSRQRAIWRCSRLSAFRS